MTANIHQPRSFLLSCDPGQASFGYSLYEVFRTHTELLRAGMLVNTIKEVSGENFYPMVQAYLNEVNAILDSAGVDRTNGDSVLLAGERYIARSMNTSTTAETVPMMLALATTLCDDAELCQASTWKGYINRALEAYGIKLEIAKAKKDELATKGITRDLYREWKAAIKVPDHVIDSMFIGKITAFKLYAHAKPETIEDFIAVFNELAAAYVPPPPKPRKSKKAIL